jgi:spore cortex biosynthesis protein YabQ
VEPVELQFYSFFVVVLAGVLLGFCFDLLRAVRGFCSPSGCLAATGDLAYWALATAILALALFLGAWGEPRLFMAVGILLGLAGYYYLASRTTLRLARFVLRTLAWALRLVRDLVLHAVIRPLRLLAALLLTLLRRVWSWLRWLGSLALAGLEWVGILCWRPLRRFGRLCRLKYLLAKRRIKRRLRAWLLPR